MPVRDGLRARVRTPPSRGESSIGPMTDSRTSGADPGLRGLLAGAVDALPEGRLAEQLTEGKTLRVKLGMDPTMPDLHLGHSVVLNRLRAFQDLGHLVVLIVGDYTARVGDPSGRDTTRPVLSPEEIEENTRTYTDQAFKVLDRERTEVRRNSEWLAMSSEELFGLMRRFTVARLLERDDFAKRIESEQPISALELLYPVLQGYDSVAVAADVELGGSDQRFNLLFARAVQESFDMPPQSILTMPLLPGTDGVRKMGKSYGNSVGITDPPEEMFGKLMSVPDDVMGDYYVLLLGREPDSEEHPGEAKRELARRLVERFHGSDAARAAEQRFDRIHVDRELPDDIEEVVISANDAVHLPALIAEQFDLSRSESRRLIEQGGVRIAGAVVEPGRLDLPAAELDGRVLQVGRRRFRRLRVEGGERGR